MKSTCMHSQAHGSDADSTVPLYLPSTHWQLVEPVTVVKLCSGQDAHGSMLCPSLNVPLGHSVKGEANTYHSKHSASIAYIQRFAKWLSRPCQSTHDSRDSPLNFHPTFGG